MTVCPSSPHSFVTRSVLRRKTKFRKLSFENLFHSGWLSCNNFRPKEGLCDVQWDDVHLARTRKSETELSNWFRRRRRRRPDTILQYNTWLLLLLLLFLLNDIK